MNPGPYTCEAYVIPLHHTPKDTSLYLQRALILLREPSAAPADPFHISILIVKL